ncbi:hypothetical protein D9756_011050 [Leucocoprinus leucothites]|uniref:Alcohol dehydrogenase n=1 Tax=Leucocoprinus leucothites TaxID=201217 RepID=A0A8H5CPI9_9AGAR|nr:hypothetical protein D9756_011050 [Leucoagaricus leucothites]
MPHTTTMKAVVYEKPFSVVICDVEKPEIQHPDDIIVKVTTSCICGSDLHMYEGRTAAEPGIVFGHENMGIVEEVGTAVTATALSCLSMWAAVDAPTAKKAALPSVPTSIQDLLAVPTGEKCTTVTLYVAMGPYKGGQAEYVRVPFADFNALKLPPGKEHEADFALLADIFPTGWHGVKLSGFKPGESVAVFGGGPVGLMAAYSGIIQGASEVYVVDRVQERLAKAQEIGCIPIDFSKGDAVDQILKLRGGREVDRGVDAVGYQATTGDGKTEQPNVVLESLIRLVKPTGGLGIPGLYVPKDPGAPDSAAAKGYISFPFGKLFEKGLTIGTGQCNVKMYNRYLRDLIIAGRAKPSFVVSHEVSLDKAPEAYDKFDRRIEGYTKVLLHP